MYEELIPKTRFTSEDLFALMGGLDAEWMICPLTMTGPDDPDLGKKRDTWRRDVVRRYKKDGLVDDAGNPCDALRRALEPLSGPSLVVADAVGPDDPEGHDERKHAVYVLPDGRATLVRRGKGFWGGWFIMPLEGEGAILEAVLALHGLGGLVRSGGDPCRILIPAEENEFGTAPDFPWLTAALNGNSSRVISEAERWGFDPSPILAFSHWWKEGGERAFETGNVISGMRTAAVLDGPIAAWAYDNIAPVSPALVEYSVSDNRKCQVEEANGISTGLTYGCSPFRAMTVAPAAGMCLSTEKTLKPGDPQQGRKRVFGSFDVLSSEEQLARTLLMVDEYPSEGSAVTFRGEEIPLWGIGGTL